jgi:hypothetical protein
MKAHTGDLVLLSGVSYDNILSEKRIQFELKTALIADYQFLVGRMFRL